MIVMLIGCVGSILLAELRKMSGDCVCPLTDGLWPQSVGQSRTVTVLPSSSTPSIPAVSASQCGEQGPLRTKGAIHLGRASWPYMDSRSMDGKRG